MKEQLLQLLNDPEVIEAIKSALLPKEENLEGKVLTDEVIIKLYNAKKLERDLVQQTAEQIRNRYQISVYKDDLEKIKQMLNKVKPYNVDLLKVFRHFAKAVALKAPEDKDEAYQMSRYNDLYFNVSKTSLTKLHSLITSGIIKIQNH